MCLPLGLVCFFLPLRMALLTVGITHTCTHACTPTPTHTHSHFAALWILSRTTWVSWYQKKHSPTHTCHGHQSSFIYSTPSIHCNPWHLPCSIYVPDSLFAQSFSQFSLVYLLVWHPSLHTPYISSPNHCLLFAAHAHTIAYWKPEGAQRVHISAKWILYEITGLKDIRITTLISEGHMTSSMTSSVDLPQTISY